MPARDCRLARRVCRWAERRRDGPKCLFMPIGVFVGEEKHGPPARAPKRIRERHAERRAGGRRRPRARRAGGPRRPAPRAHAAAARAGPVLWTDHKYIILKFNVSSARLDADVRLWRSVALFSLAATMPVAAAPRLALAPAAAVARWVAAEDLVDSDAHEVPVAVWLEQLLRGGGGAGGGARWGACAVHAAPWWRWSPLPNAHHSPLHAAVPPRATLPHAAPRRVAPTPGASPAAA